MDDQSHIVAAEAAVTAALEPPRRRFFSRRRKAQPPALPYCENCGAPMAGAFCAQCGQAAVDYRRSFRHVIVDVLDSFLNWDSKFFGTIGLLVTRPWRLTNAFLAGQRVRYLHPARLYLLASILFFFAATYGIKSAHFQAINLSPEGRAEIRTELEQENVAPEIRARVEQALGGKPVSPEKRAVLEEQLKNENLPKEARDAIQERLDHGDIPSNTRAEIEKAMKGVPPEAREKVEQSLRNASQRHTIFEADKNDQPNDVGDWLQKRSREKFGEHGTNMQLFLVTLISNLPYMMLACIPLFALVLKLLYIRRRIFYIDHLVYAFHIHSFAYLMIMLNVLLTIGLNRVVPGAVAGCIIALLWITFAVQIFLSIRRVYKQGWFFSVLKFFVGGVAYFAVLSVALIATFLITLATP
jgi:Protein of unknown function (DUF3667)